jgi:glycosyltransferase involved in cell wall biosynthesis
MIKTCRLVAKKEHNKSNTSVIVYSRNITTVMALKLICKIKKFPVVLELCEWPASQASSSWISTFKKKLFCRFVLKFTDAVISISDAISCQVQAGISKRKSELPIIKIPILSDKKEFDGVPSSVADDNYLFYSGSLSYRSTILHVLKSYAVIRPEYPNTKLFISGDSNSKEDLNYLHSQIKELELTESVKHLGFVTRDELIGLMRNARALLIPLFDDAVSKARFPNKLAEYLFSGRPVITSDIGEVGHYLTHGQDALFAEPNSPQDFASKVATVLIDPSLGDKIGQAGYRTAESVFYYKSYRQPLREWLEGLTCLNV